MPRARLNEGAKCGKCKRALFVGQVLALTHANFHPHIAKSDIPVVVDFWAPWCGSCKMMAPLFEQAAAQLEPEVRLTKLNTAAEQGIANEFGIRSIPTLNYFQKRPRNRPPIGSDGFKQFATLGTYSYGLAPRNINNILINISF